MTVPIDERSCPSAFELFSNEFAGPLDDYSRRLQTLDVDLIIAISRKGPRLLQLMAEIPEVSDPDLSICISEKALPFLPRENLPETSVGITDDTMAYGSTFARNFETLREAGANPRGEVLAMSRMASRQARELLTGEPLLLPEVEIRRLIDLEIQAFGGLAVPYDIDHPIFTVPFDGDIQALAERLEREWPEARRPTNPWHEASGVTVISLPTPELVLGNHSQAKRRLGPQKLRLFLDGRRRAVRAVAIFALALREHELRDPELFVEGPPALGEAWRELLGAIEAAGWPEKNQNLALANAAHYLAGCEALWLWLGSTELGIESSRGRISELDLRLLFGPTMAARLHTPLQTALREADSITPLKPARLPSTPELFDPEAEIAALLATERGEAFAAHVPEHLKMAARYDPDDQIHALFNAQRRTYDEETRANEGIEVERLSLGLLPFPLVVPLLARFGAAVRERDFEHFADLAIDGGSIVPHYAASLSQPDLWIRSVRAGERDSEKLKHWVHDCVTEAQRAFERTHKVKEDQRGIGVPWFVTEKLFAVLALALESVLKRELPQPATCGRDEFGARAVLPDVSTGPYLLDWATDFGLLERSDGSIPRLKGNVSRGTFVRPAAAFRDLYPEDRNVVDRMLAHPSRTITDAFIAIEASLEGKSRDRALLAMSSCGTYSAYLESLSAEVEVWLHSKRANPHGLSVRLQQLAGEPGNKRLGGEIGRGLLQAARALAQTAIKRDAFETRVAVRDEIDALIEADEVLGPHYVTWSDYLRPLIDENEDHPYDPAERYLTHASDLGRRAASVALTALTEHRLLQARGNERPPLDSQVDRYRETLAQADAEGLSYPRPAIDDQALLSQDPARALHSAAKLLSGTQNAVQQIWDTWRRPGSPSPIQPISGVHALLMWDIVDSSSVDPQTLQDAIHRVNERVKAELQGLGSTTFHPDHDDCKAVVLPTVAAAMEIFTTVAEILTASGIRIRAGVETTGDGRPLSVNKRSGEFAGAGYVIAKRTMDAFAELEANKTGHNRWIPAAGDTTEPAPPDGSHLLVTDRALKQLREAEAAELPPGLDRHGVIEGYVPRNDGSLSLDVTCFSAVRPQ